MDVIVNAVFAVVIAVIAALVALLKRKKLGKICIYAFSGLIIGLFIGYVLTPTVISFF